MEGGEVGLQLAAARRLEAGNDRSDRPVAADEEVPRGLPAREPQRSDAALVFEIERIAEQFLEPLAPAPDEGRRQRIGRGREVVLHYPEEALHRIAGHPGD